MDIFYNRFDSSSIQMTAHFQIETYCGDQLFKRDDFSILTLDNIARMEW